MLDLTQLGNS